jgi:hypothetical protein
MAGKIDWQPARFLARNCIGGIMGGWALLLWLVWTDAAGIGALIHSAELGWLGLLLLAAAFGLTGGAVGMAVAVMTMGRR